MPPVTQTYNFLLHRIPSPWSTLHFEWGTDTKQLELLDVLGSSRVVLVLVYGLVLRVGLGKDRIRQGCWEPVPALSLTGQRLNAARWRSKTARTYSMYATGATCLRIHAVFRMFKVTVTDTYW